MEISVGFADKDSSYYIECGYTEHKSELGNVYILEDQLETAEHITIRYEKHPWIECFEIDGVKLKPIKRTGYGIKDAKGFVKSLSTIYAKAYQEYAESYDDALFFSEIAEDFVHRFVEENETKMFKKFCGFTENMWREGNKEMHDVVMEYILPIFRNNQDAWNLFHNNITEEFSEYLEKYCDRYSSVSSCKEVPRRL